MAGTFSIYKYCKTNSGWRYCKAAFHSNGKIKPNVVIVSGVEEKHIEGRYFLNFNGQWIDAGVDALEAQRRRQLRLNQIEYERLSRKSSVAAHSGRPSVVEFSGRKVIKDEVEAYLADLELTCRPARTVQSKRKYLGDFVGLIGKEFADEYRREDVLKYKNNLQHEGFAPKTIDTRMMAVVSETSASRVTVLLGRAETSMAPLILTFGGRFASLNLGVTANFRRSAKSFCAAAKKESEIAVVRGEILGIMLAKSMVVPPQDRWNPNDSPTLRVITLN